MRVLLAGLLLLFLTGAAFAQDAAGEVESIGYGGDYRPNCWTPMKLRLRPKVGDTRTYKIAIVQEDLDRDRVLYTRPFTLNGNPQGGGQIEEHVWAYFMPQPQLHRRPAVGTKSPAEADAFDLPLGIGLSESGTG